MDVDRVLPRHERLDGDIDITDMGTDADSGETGVMDEMDVENAQEERRTEDEPMDIVDVEEVDMMIDVD